MSSSDIDQIINVDINDENLDESSKKSKKKVTRKRKLKLTSVVAPKRVARSRTQTNRYGKRQSAVNRDLFFENISSSSISPGKRQSFFFFKNRTNRINRINRTIRINRINQINRINRIKL